MKALIIKDLAAAKQLDASDMSAIHGGSNFNFGNNNFAAGGGFASPSIVVAPVTQVDATSIVRTDLLQNFGGLQAVGAVCSHTPGAGIYVRRPTIRSSVRGLAIPCR